ncbi:MAG: hypothetical protein KC983_11060, partial [Phycisphaerales bacterium]|nr:hypothetical protein [Phycisphaerales bacterium]
VEIRSTSGATHLVRWDQVRDVQTDRHEPLLPQMLERAERLWRARSRLERYDAAFAEPLFIRLFEQYRGQTHETALVVAEGLLRCRLESGENDGALIPWLETVRIRRAGIAQTAYVTLPPVIDDDTFLAPSLAPFFVPTRSLVSVARELEMYDARGDAVVAAFAQLYSDAIRRTLGQDSITIPAPAVAPPADQRGLMLLGLMLSSDDPNADVRATTRSELERRLMDLDATSWQDAWLRSAYGRALIASQGVGRQQLGIVQLIHVPARHATTQPYLAGLALDWAAAALETLGDADGAARLRAELDRKYPGHPVRPAGGESSRRIRS